MSHKEEIEKFKKW